MLIRNFALAVLVGATLAGAPAHAGMRSLEDAIEGSTISFSLPRTVGGALVARACSECAPMVLRLEAKSKLLIGKQQVALAEFNRFLSDGSTRGVTVFYDKKARTITRIVVVGTSVQRPTAK